MKCRHRVTLTFDGPATDEQATPNPFTDYRLIVTFTQGDRKVVAPGFYAADGNAGQTGADAGRKWRAHFAPETAGAWTYVASFRAGKNVVLAPGPDAGRAAAFDGETGSLTILASDKTGRDFRAHGFLRHDGKSHYARFSGSKQYFLKGGADSPENLLGYADFDGTYDTGAGRKKGEAAGGRLHAFAPHVRDWRKGDPTWRNGKGKGIIGAMNYLASKGMNSVYFIPYNIDGGDGKDTWPWTSHTEKFRFDCSKLDQWEIVFEHMTRLGLAMHPITQEQENDQGLDKGELGPQRKLYYRELIARFAHHPAIVWNLGEENTNTDDQRKAFTEFIRATDPYDHPIVVHTFPGRYESVYGPLLGHGDFNGPSLQMGNMRATHAETLRWVARSAASGRRWMVCLDEIGPANTGVKPDKDDPTHDDVRRYPLWGNLMAGGAGVEWYFGYKYAHNDLNCEDWRSRDTMWDQTRYALEFVRKLPFWAMRGADELTAATDDYVFCREGMVYAVYTPSGGQVRVPLPDGAYGIQWYNPRRGGACVAGEVKEVAGGADVSIGEPPAEKDKDWVALIRAHGSWTLDYDAVPTAFPKGHPALKAGSRSDGRHARAKKKTGKPPAITGLALIEIANGKPVPGFDPIPDGATIHLKKLAPNRLTLIARTSGDVDSVRFGLDGKANVQTERQPPYCLSGDTDGVFKPWSLGLGQHTVTADAEGPGGKKAQRVKVTFTLVGP